MLNRLLRLIVDHNIADYMTAKNNVMISYKVRVGISALACWERLMFFSAGNYETVVVTIQRHWLSFITGYGPSSNISTALRTGFS